MSRENRIHRTMRLMTCCAFNRINAHLLNGYSFRYIFHFLFLIEVYKLFALTSSDNVGREIFLNFPPLIQLPISFRNPNLWIESNDLYYYDEDLRPNFNLNYSIIHNNDILRINWYPITDFKFSFSFLHYPFAIRIAVHFMFLIHGRCQLLSFCGQMTKNNFSIWMEAVKTVLLWLEPFVVWFYGFF